jgi:hypothetical protein
LSGAGKSSHHHINLARFGARIYPLFGYIPSKDIGYSVA